MLSGSRVVEVEVVLTKGALDTAIELDDVVPKTLLEEFWLDDVLVWIGTEVLLYIPVLLYIGMVAEGDETLLLMLALLLLMLALLLPLTLLGRTEVNVVEELMLDAVYDDKGAVLEVIARLLEEPEVVKVVEFANIWLEDRVEGKLVKEDIADVWLEDRMEDEFVEEDIADVWLEDKVVGELVTEDIADTWLEDKVEGEFVEDDVVELGKTLLVEGLVPHSQLLM